MLWPKFRLRKVNNLQEQEKINNKTITDKVSVAQIVNNPESLVKEKSILEIKSVFPFEIFPDVLTITDKSVTVSKRFFLFSNNETILIKDIGFIELNDGFIFASLVINYKAPRDQIDIAHLIPNSAYKAKSIIEKLMLVKNDELNPGEKLNIEKAEEPVILS